MDGMSAVVITDRQNRIIKVNNEFTRLSGYTFEDVKGKQPSILLLDYTKSNSICRCGKLCKTMAYGKVK